MASTETSPPPPPSQTKTSKLKTLAEQKYNQSKLKSALKHAKRALRLSPYDTTISDMVTTFKILYLYSKSSPTHPPEWYEILQIEPFSHINSIKKQYKKLALTLHPDKNTCIASEEAFKCVSEAFQVLSDKIRRKEYDLKLRIALQSQAVGSPVGSPGPVIVETFWTACSTCKLFHQFERRYVGCKLMCPSCRKSFLAKEVVVRDDGVEEFDEFEDGARGKRKRIDELGDSVRLGDWVRARKKIGGSRNGVGRKRRIDELDDDGVAERDSRNGVGRKRRIDELDDVVAERREERKRRIDELDDVVGVRREDGESSPRFNLRSLSKKGKSSRGEMTLAEMQMEAKRKFLEEKKKMKGKGDKVEQRKVKEKGKGNEKVNEKRRVERRMVVHSRNGHRLEVMRVDDSDFYNFDKDRTERCFKRSQVWAIYDDDDGMPRHYGLIDEVSTFPFEVKMSWLDMESNGDERLICWEKSGFHISCGRFKVSRKTTISSVNIFSHVVDCERVAREVYRVYPKKGSIWALYNERALEADDGNTFLRDKRCYDIVVSLTTYSEMHGLSMAYLEKVEGFKTIFKRQEIGCHAVKWIEKDDFRLFSHQIPAKKLSDTETPDTLGDCWELDPASLPPDLLTIEEGR